MRRGGRPKASPAAAKPRLFGCSLERTVARAFLRQLVHRRDTGRGVEVARQTGAAFRRDARFAEVGAHRDADAADVRVADAATAVGVLRADRLVDEAAGAGRSTLGNVAGRLAVGRRRAIVRAVAD